MKCALVVGGARGVWDDVIAARGLGEFAAVYCVNLIGVAWPASFKTWVTLHPEFMDGYETSRASRGHPNGYEVVAPLVEELGRHGAKGRITRRVSHRWPGMNGSGSSGIYAAKVALEDGFDRVVLAGVPMEAGAGHFARCGAWLEVETFRSDFEKAVPFLHSKVKSMSGRTRDILGEPTPAWIKGE